MKTKNSFLLSVLIFVNSFTFSQNQNLYENTAEEKVLYDLIMAYRKQFDLPRIPISRSLNFVAHTHAIDLKNNYKHNDRCNLHSWSNKGNWTACCYTPDHANADCVWSKPGELTNYKHYGFEIAHWNPSGPTASSALNAWKKSPAHKNMIINKENWSDNEWKAIGIAIYEEYAVVWFGMEPDR